MRYFLPILLAAVPVLGRAADNDGFVSLFNGRDLSGWVNVNCAPETWSVRSNMIYCTGQPTGALRTTRQYENFVFEVEWRHLTSGGNSGIFIWSSPIAAPGVPFLRAIEVQVLDHGYNEAGKNEWFTTHGDVFPIHGSTMKPFGRHRGSRSFPSEERSKPSPEWNQYRIVCQDGVLRLSVNGKEVSGGEECDYRKGYIGLEAEGAPIEFRNLRLRELPSSGAPIQATAPLDPGWRSLFTGLDLRGWRTNAATAARWNVTGERLHLTRGPGQPEATLWTDESYTNAEFVIDCQLPKGAGLDVAAAPVLQLRGREGKGVAVPLKIAKPGAYQRFVVAVKGTMATIQSDGQTEQVDLGARVPDRGALGLSAIAGAVEFMNLYVRGL